MNPIEEMHLCEQISQTNKQKKVDCEFFIKTNCVLFNLSKLHFVVKLNNSLFVS